MSPGKPPLRKDASSGARSRNRRPTQPQQFDGEESFRQLPVPENLRNLPRSSRGQTPDVRAAIRQRQNIEAGQRRRNRERAQIEHAIQHTAQNERRILELQRQVDVLSEELASMPSISLSHRDPTNPTYDPANNGSSRSSGRLSLNSRQGVSRGQAGRSNEN